MDISYATANVFYDKLKPQMSSFESLSWQLLGGCLLQFVFFYSEIVKTPLFHRFTWEAILLGAINTTMAFRVYWFVVEKYGNVQASQAPIISPVFAVIISISVGETGLSSSYILATAMILVSVKLSQKSMQS